MPPVGKDRSGRYGTVTDDEKTKDEDCSMKINGAVFDMDGTLVDSLTFWASLWGDIGREYLQDPSFTVPKEVDRKIRTMVLRDAMVYVKDFCKLDISAEELEEFTKRQLETFYRTVVTVMGNAEAFLKHLKAKGIPMVLATATEQKYVDVVMERLGLDQYFDVMLSCVDLGVGKDRPDIYLESAKRLGLEAGEICVFEDSYVALETAKAAGFQTVGIFDENNFRQDRLEAASDIYIAKGADIGDLIPMI